MNKRKRERFTPAYPVLWAKRVHFFILRQTIVCRTTKFLGIQDLFSELLCNSMGLGEFQGQSPWKDMVQRLIYTIARKNPLFSKKYCLGSCNFLFIVVK